jgi:hypothetical protein
MSLLPDGGLCVYKEKRTMTTQTIATTETYLSATSDVTVSQKGLWTGHVLSGLIGFLFLLDGGAKLFKPAPIVQATMQLGYPESSIIGIGILLIASTVLYLVPRTGVLGAILLSAYLGGAVATHVRVSAPWFNIFFPVFFGGLVWVGLYLRDRRLELLFAR